MFFYYFCKILVIEYLSACALQISCYYQSIILFIPATSNLHSCYLSLASARLNLLETPGTTGVAGRTRSSRVLLILGLPVAYWNLDRYLVDPVELPSPRQI